MVPKPLVKRKALVPATAVRRPDGVGNRRPTWIGRGGRHQSECPADIVGLGGKNEVDRFDTASDRQIGGLSAFENATGIGANLAINVREVGSVTHQAANFYKLPRGIDRRYHSA